MYGSLDQIPSQGDVPTFRRVYCHGCAHGADHPLYTTGWTFWLEVWVDQPSGFDDPYVDWDCNGYCCKHCSSDYYEESHD